MLKLDLARLEREGTLPVAADVPADDPLWEGRDLRFEGPLRVRLTARVAGTGEIVVLGTLNGVLDAQCRRCLEPVRVPVQQKVTLVYAPSDALESGDEGDVRPLSPRASTLDLSDAVREELILGVDRYVVCDAGCQGLCPLCGVNRNQETCDCTLEAPDPRWDALRALKNE
jgi:uncharacterized protein